MAAIIPSLLYYRGLFVQVDGYAKRVGLKGIPREELPPLGDTLRQGWYYLLTLVVLFYFLVTLRVEAWAPYYASALLIVLAVIRKETRLNWQKTVDLIFKQARC